MECLKAQHVFDEWMTLLKDVVEILDLQDFNHSACACKFHVSVDGLQSGQIRIAFINDDLNRNTIACGSFLKETVYRMILLGK